VKFVLARFGVAVALTVVLAKVLGEFLAVDGLGFVALVKSIFEEVGLLHGKLSLRLLDLVQFGDLAGELFDGLLHLDHHGALLL
jgi:hypothetical protein